MFLKIMSAENLSDSDSRKSFKLLDHVESAEFFRKPEGAQINVLFEGGDNENFPCEGNAYLMNDNGKTVAQFGPAGLPDAA
jgi:hypothetical protein